jgi:hypothetical protein
MGMFGKLLESIGSQWRMCKEDTRMMLCGGFVKEERELQAMKNLVHVSRERVWLAEDHRQREYNTSFSDALDDDQKRLITESAKVVEDLLKKETELRRKHVK